MYNCTDGFACVCTNINFSLVTKNNIIINRTVTILCSFVRNRNKHNKVQNIDIYE